MTSEGMPTPGSGTSGPSESGRSCDHPNSVAGTRVRTHGRETHFLRHPTRADSTRASCEGLFQGDFRSIGTDHNKCTRGYDEQSSAVSAAGPKIVRRPLRG